MPDKTVAQKLQVKEGYEGLLVNEPQDYISLLGELPENARILRHTEKPVDFIQVFVSSRKELEGQLPGLKSLLKPKGLVWVTYPKGTSKTKVDVNRDSIREYAHSIGLEAVALVAVNATWSALRLKVA